MPRPFRINILKLDPFLLALIATVGLASLLPCRGQFAAGMEWITDAGIVLLFFLHGARLSREAIIAGLGAWRIHILTLAATFVLFPAIGLALRALSHGWLNPAIADGLLFLCLLPSTVQSSIAFTSIARGNVPAAVCSASASNVLGIFITPVLVGLFLMSGSRGGFAADSLLSIVLQLLLPFVLGHFSRPRTDKFISKHKSILGKVDRTTILLVVYTAFSAAVIEGLWHKYSVGDLAWTFALNGAILALVLFITRWTAKRVGLPIEDEIAVVFCGSKKSLASGVPMASVLFPPVLLGPMVLPLMLFHQMQLMVCAVLAQRYGERPSN
ncbi:sodium/bile acid cotransporter 7 [Rhizomicrobium palustre]|uniref:Sodium/bile acid cotransporter 7 n=1 Tax=Rhizomicrobium palustre TaxID=189966 RepID=A0A846MZB4_9PROT|nr:bile acid:sodium symporter family protein [Rhizomicrobium palustre]NIK88575.1 sodium/bile acid cotransporter 7 [Rhizomicrobium palustre]